MMYLIKKNGKYALPYNIWVIVKQYAGVYNLTTDYSAANTMRAELLYEQYRKWFGRFIIPDYYDLWDEGKRRKWLLKNLVVKNNYKMTEERYNRLILISNSPVNLLE